MEKIRKATKEAWFLIIPVLAVAAIILIGLSGQGKAATLSDFVTGDHILSQSGYDPGTQARVPFYQARKFDFGAATLKGGSGVSNNDVVRLFTIPKDTIIMEIGIIVDTAAVNSGVSGEVGDGADIDGYVGNDNTAAGVPFIDLSTATSGASVWQYTGLKGLVSGASPAAGTFTHNMGPYFSTKGASPYQTNSDTIDMTVYTPVEAAKTPWSGATPVFRMWVKGFHIPEK